MYNGLKFTQIYIGIYVLISLGGCNLDTFYFRKLEFGTQTKTFDSVQVLSMGHALGWG